MNDGTRDIGNTQAPVLLFRGLDPLSGPQAIAQAMKTSSGLGKEGARGMRRIILIKDKTTSASWGFAFVEFVDIEVRRTLASATGTVDSGRSPPLPFSQQQCLPNCTRMASEFPIVLSLRRLRTPTRSNHSRTTRCATTRA